MIERFLKSYFVEGDLMIRLPDRDVIVGGKSAADVPVKVRLASYDVARRIARLRDLAVGEAYMNGALVMERGTIYDLLEVITRNFKHHKNKRIAFAFRSRRHDRKSSRANVAHHYDLSYDLYRRFLDADMQYSCAYFPYPGASLEAAQAAKKRHIAAKLLIEPDARVLDIGSGWGGLALTLARDFEANVEGVTLSREQLAVSRRRAEDAKLEDRVRFRLTDYRDLTEPYDRIVSVGMLEHVGPENYQAFFDAVARLLNKGGVALIHSIGRLDGPRRTSPWIEKYIFPGGYIPALSELSAAIEKSGLVMTDVEVLRLHYADTIRAWRQRFATARTDIATLYGERFCRMWEFYLAGSEASFRVGSSVVYQFQLAKRIDAVPLRRDYITDFDRKGAREEART